MQAASAKTHLGGHDQLMINNVVWGVAHSKEGAGGMQVAGFQPLLVPVGAGILDQGLSVQGRWGTLPWRMWAWGTRKGEMPKEGAGGSHSGAAGG